MVRTEERAMWGYPVLFTIFLVLGSKFQTLDLIAAANIDFFVS